MKTIIMKVNPKKPSKHIIESAAKLLKHGGIIIYPTETCYGMGCDATNARAVAKIHKLKKQSKNKPITIIVSDTRMAKKYCVIDKGVEKLIRKHMPGPLTLIVRKKKLPNILAKKNVGFRISSNKIATELARKLGKPITATSANIHGKPEIYDAKKLSLFTGRVDMILDAGKLRRRKPSTIYDCVSGKIIRKGPVVIS